MIGFIKCYFAMKMQRFKHALSRRNSLERKCYSNSMRLYYQGNTSSKMLPRQDECLPRFYLGKDEVECGNTASMTRGGPAVRTRQMGQYFQVVLYAAFFDKLVQEEKVSRCRGCTIQHPSQRQHSCLMLDILVLLL